MTDPTKLGPADLLQFIARPGATVVFLSAHPAHGFNTFLCECFEAEQGVKVAFGQLPMLELFDSASPAASFLYSEILACGVQVPLAVPPGYYLFQRGHMIGWDSGLPTPSEAKRILRGALLGAVATLVARNLRFVNRALRYAAEEAAARKIAFRFRRIADAARENPRRASDQTSTTPDDLAHAYGVLNVDPSASDDEVNRAWRKLQQKYHPDRAGRDLEAFDRLSRLAVEINRARDTIRSHRRRTRRRAAAQ